jgi:hypothetical protein
MKILQLTTYDVDRPDHGGKLRSHHIRKSLRTRFSVETLAFEWGEHDDASTLQIVLDQKRWDELGLNELLSDWGICSYLEHYPEIYFFVAAKVQAYAPDVLLIEQPFLWPLAQRLLGDGTVQPDVKIIYSSHNVEVEMKRKIYAQAFLPETAGQFTEYVDAIEKEVISHAHAALAVSRNDAAYISEVAPDISVRVFGNGHMRPSNNDQDEKWCQLFAGHEFNWVFVGSWHPPNMNGTRALLEAMPKCLDSKRFALWILGSAGKGLLSNDSFCVADYPYLKIMGPVLEDDIDAAILNSSGVVLPIWEGGGSNLKTAQALLSGKSIVGSNFSFRGFETYMDEDGVFLGETPDEVSRLLLEARPLESYMRSRLVVDLEWDEITKELGSYLGEICGVHNTAR